MGYSRIPAPEPGSLPFSPYSLLEVSAGLFLSHFSHSSSTAAAKCFFTLSCVYYHRSNPSAGDEHQL